MSEIIYSTNNKASFDEFRDLMKNIAARLNLKAKENPEFFNGANYTKVEEIVFNEMVETAKGTPFEGTIEHVSGLKFPDIIAGKYYGTEVKSTTKNKWDSFGNSIFEGSRVDDIERIFLVFGKMKPPVEFRFKPYEECVSDIVVDHSPRYHIDMKIQEKNQKTIFENLNISYDKFRKFPNEKQVELIAEKRKEELKEGETLWWSIDSEEKPIEDKLKIFSYLDNSEKEQLTAFGLSLFPELFESTNPNKYSRFLMWLVTDRNIITGNVRDIFSAGGRFDFKLKCGLIVRAPAIINRLDQLKESVVDIINETSVTELKDFWKVDSVEEDRVSQWINLCSTGLEQFRGLDKNLAKEILNTIFDEYLSQTV